MEIDIVGVTTDAPLPAGPYSQSRRIGDLVSCAGQAGISPDGLIGVGLEEQTRIAIKNIDATLSAVGAQLSDIIHVRVYLTDPGQFEIMNSVYAEFFSAPFPARTTVTVGLPLPLLIEIDALAVVRGRVE